MKQTDEKFQAIVDDLYPRLYKFLVKLTRNPHDAADLTQESILRAYKVRDQRREELCPEGWFFKIAYRCFLDRRRYNRSRPTTVSIEGINTGNSLFEAPDHAPNPEEELLALELSEPMEAALSCLTRDQRELIRLAHLEQMTHKELAAIYGCGATTIKTRIHRATVTMKKRLQAFGYDTNPSVMAVSP